MSKRLTIIELDECASTNDEAWKVFAADSPKNDEKVPVLIVARRQTKGRGRQGRRWAAGPFGNISMSLLLRPPVGLQQQISFVPLAAGVAAAEALAQATEIAGGAELDDLHIKWPNDVMWGARKLGGVLCESRVVGDKLAALVVGVGLNIIAAPALEAEGAIPVPVASFFEDVLGGRVARSRTPTTTGVAIYWFVVREWATRFTAWVEQLANGESELLRRTWEDLAKLDRYGHLAVHDRSGALVAISPRRLDTKGRLEAVLESEHRQVVFLDQADSL